MTHHATRYVEFWLIVFMIMWGIDAGNNPAALSDPIYSVMTLWADHRAWSGTVGAIGIVHLAAWYHNGHGMWWTGPMRAWGCVATAVVFAVMSVGAYLAVGITPAAIGYAAATLAATHSALANIIRFMSYRGLMTGHSR